MRWYENSYRRGLVDMHIDDWDSKFLSLFDSKEYVEMQALAKVQTVIFFASSNVGICYYPSRVGHMHEGIKGRDILGEVIDFSHREGMSVVVYYNIWHKWAHDNHPDWRMVTAKGENSREYMRYGVCCINSPFKDFVITQTEELCKNYKFAGLWFDMIGLHTVCYCSHCRKRYLLETGEEIPRIINWEDPKWVKFQRKREEWLAEFASLLVSTAKKVNPDITVGFQNAHWPNGWRDGLTLPFFEAQDYISGDFYGGALEQSFVCKLFYSLTPNKPFEYMTSRCPTLLDHTTMKSKELLEAQMYSVLANNGAFCFIDAIDPEGTLNRDFYVRMGELFQEMEKYEKYLDHSSKFCQDVGIYLSFESLINPEDNGKRTSELTYQRSPHLEAAVNVAKTLLNAHIPFGVITKKNLDCLSDYQIIILPNLLMIDEEEVDAFRKFVEFGGSIYASGAASLLTKDGIKQDNFLLSDLFGVSYSGETKENLTYVTPKDDFKDVFAGYSPRYPLTLLDTQLKVRKIKENATVLATITLPYTDPKDISRFVSANSNPPGISTDLPSIVLNQYGKGKVIYSGGVLELMKENDHRSVVVNLIRLISNKPFFFEVDAPKSVEVTLFHQEDKKQYFINLLNYQPELPNIPISDIKIRIKLDNRKPRRLMLLPEEKELDFKIEENYIECIAPELETFLMICLEYN